jgi:hypothetical protein
VLCGNTGRYACTCDGMPSFDTPEEMLAHLRANGITAVPINIMPRRLWPDSAVSTPPDSPSGPAD